MCGGGGRGGSQCPPSPPLNESLVCISVTMVATTYVAYLENVLFKRSGVIC